MLDAAVKKGLSEIAITDHYDPDYPDRAFPFDLDFQKYYENLNLYEIKYRDKIKLIKGIEIGIQRNSIEKCKKAALDFEYDFIIGSFHCSEGKELYGGGYFSEKNYSEKYIDFYTYVFACLLNFSNFSVLGHINIIDRYSDVIPSFSYYSDIIDSILRLLIETGKGIEINTSSFRYSMGDVRTPSSEILKRYKELGGEILTLGSDAHFPEHVAYKFKESFEYLANFNFKYLTTFTNLVPSQIKIIS
jgi:histidinol-phosphatase (PHP family)